MRTTMKLSIAALSLATGLAACAGGKATDAATQDDFKQDLQLASSTTMDLAAPKVAAGRAPKAGTSPLTYGDMKVAMASILSGGTSTSSGGT